MQNRFKLPYLWINTRGATRTLGCGWVWWRPKRITSWRTGLWKCPFCEWCRMSLHPRRRWCDTALFRVQPKGFKPSCLFMSMIGWQLHDISANWKMVQKGQIPNLLLGMQWKVSDSKGWVDKYAVPLVILTCPVGQWSLLGNSISNYRKTVINPAQQNIFQAS